MSCPDCESTTRQLAEIRELVIRERGIRDRFSRDFEHMTDLCKALGAVFDQVEKLARVDALWSEVSKSLTRATFPERQ